MGCAWSAGNVAAGGGRIAGLREGSQRSADRGRGAVRGLYRKLVRLGRADD